jgi:hypothetical protein
MERKALYPHTDWHQSWSFEIVKNIGNGNRMKRRHPMKIPGFMNLLLAYRGSPLALYKTDVEFSSLELWHCLEFACIAWC